MPDMLAPVTSPPPRWSVVVPVYGSEASLPTLYARLVATLDALGDPYELIFVDDCGPDRAWTILTDLAAADPRVVAIQLMRNSGQVAATMAGLTRARGQVIVTLDDDLQHPPEEIPVLLQALATQTDVDLVIGAPAITRHHAFRRWSSTAVHRLGSWMLGKDPDLRFTGFRAMRRPVADGLRTMRAPFPSLGPMLFSITRRIVNVQVRHEARVHGRSGYTARRLLRQTVDNFVGYSMLPLRLLALMGGIGVLVSALIGGYFLMRYAAYGVGVPGWMSLILIVLALSGFQFFAFAVIGEYLLRIMQHTMTSPQTLVRQVVTTRAAE